jgi:hypothetical protein
MRHWVLRAQHLDWFGTCRHGCKKLALVLLVPVLLVQAHGHIADHTVTGSAQRLSHPLNSSVPSQQSAGNENSAETKEADARWTSGALTTDTVVHKWAGQLP